MSALSNTPRTETRMRLEAYKSFALGLQFKKASDSSPVPITGSIVRLVIRKPKTKGYDIVVDMDAVIIDDGLGLAQFALQASHLALPADEYPFSVTLVGDNGYSATAMKGTVEILENTDTESAESVYAGINTATNLAVYLEEGNVVEVQIANADALSISLQNSLPQLLAIRDEANEAAASAEMAAATALQAALNPVSLQDEYITDLVAAMFVAGSNVTLVKNDAANTVTITANVTASVDPEAIRDTAAAMLRAGSGLTLVVDDAADTATFAVVPDAEFVRDTLGVALQVGAGLTKTVDDAGDSVTIGLASGGAVAPGQMIARTVRNGTTSSIYSTTAGQTPVDIDATNLSVAFVVPPSGKVHVYLEGTIDMPSNGFGWWSLRQGTTNVPGTEARMITRDIAYRAHRRIYLEGLTPGATVTYKWAHRSAQAVMTLRCGGTNAEFLTSGNGSVGPAVMEVYAA